jgi:hypothetical protein
MGGLEAVRALKNLNPNVITIASSDCPYDPVLANYRDYGFNATSDKPYNISALLLVLNKTLPKKDE